MNRRNFLSSMVAAPLVTAPAVVFGQAGQGGRGARGGQAPAAAPAAPQTPPVARTKIRQSVMGSVWGNSPLSFEERCKVLARIGFKAVDLPTAAQVPILKAHGLVPAMMTGTGSSFQVGLIRKEEHARFEDETRKGIDMCVELGCPNLIGLPGERRGMPWEEASDNAVAYFNRVKGYAEQKGITLCMEITNSKVVADQRTDQVFNHVAWGFDVCRKVNSPRVKVVYDIYHVQIADGDVVRTLRDNFDKVCHIHTAGVPGRLEIDDTQELNYRFIANAIADLGYTGFVAHEHRPSPGKDPVQSLEKCYEILNV
jgi:hydroxypyruvate isomerase